MCGPGGAGDSVAHRLLDNSADQRELFLLLVISVAKATVELTDDTWETAVAGKSAFVKFFAPWCGHCKAMKPAWDELAAEYEGHASILIADVDCTGKGEKLCGQFGVEGFPTIKYFNPPDDEGEAYEGGRDLEALMEFAATGLGPGCGVGMEENCSEDQLEDLKEVLKMPQYEIEEELAHIKEELAAAKTAHDELVESLQNQYDESEKKLDAIKKEASPRIKMLKMAIPKDASKPASGNKDEV